MHMSGTFDQFEEHWKAFLSHLERVWNKSQAHFGRSPKWKSWKARFEKQRDRDPLLRYLRVARGAHEHTTEDILVKESGFISISAGPTGSGAIRNLSFDKGDWKMELISGSITIITSPDHARPLPVKERGRVLSVPTSHLGKTVDPSDLIGLATTGLAYYEKFLEEAESFFVTEHDV